MEKPSLRDIKIQHSQCSAYGGAETETYVFRLYTHALLTLPGPAVAWEAGLSVELHGTSKLPMVVVLNLLLVPVPGATVRVPHGALA